MKYWIYPLLSLLLLGGVARADDAGIDQVKAVMNKVMPDTQPDTVRQSPVKGLYEVAYGARIYYVSADGKYLISGDMFDLKNETNMTESLRGTARLSAINTLGEKNMIVYPAKGKAKHTITVFTDIDCPYCRKLHEGMKEMNDLGITVRYLAFPRAGIPSASYDKAVSVWCAADRNKAMDDAKLHSKIEGKSCTDNPVKQELQLGSEIGVTGTPALVLDDGSLIPGYVPPQRLAAMLDQHVAQRN